MLSYADSPKQNASQVASLNQESSIKQLVTHESTTIKTTSRDKFENYNRNAYRMNDKIDKIVVRPTAIGYVTYVPSPIRTVLSNFFNNLRDFVTLGNDILQLNGQ